MRYQGRITNWKDDKGFGFITPNGGGNKVFAHIGAFSNRRRRPVESDLVTYELRVDAEGRAQAASIAFVGEQITPPGLINCGGVSLLFAVFFLAFLTAAVLSGRLPFAVLGLYLGASAIAFVAYALDKSAAINDRWRTQESTLHLFGLIGGWPGALVAQHLLRHKSKKTSFQRVFWASVVLNCCTLGWLFSPAGAWALRSVLGAM